MVGELATAYRALYARQGWRRSITTPPCFADALEAAELDDLFLLAIPTTTKASVLTSRPVAPVTREVGPHGEAPPGPRRHPSMEKMRAGPLIMQLDDNSITDLWLALRWGAEQ
jgi:hypothetical protein